MITIYSLLENSWAADGRSFPELAEGVSARLNGRGVKACSLGFSGRNSRLLNSELQSTFPKEKIYSFYKQSRIDKVVIMNGVNDVIQHVGAHNYARYTKELVAYFSSAADVEVISIPRVDEVNFVSRNILAYLKRLAFRCYYDSCNLAVNSAYRSELRKSFPEVRVLEYDNFIVSYAGNEKKYTPDGIHLTDEYFHRYGTFIGNSASLHPQS